MVSLCQGMTSYYDGSVLLKRRRKGEEMITKRFLVLYREIQALVKLTLASPVRSLTVNSCLYFRGALTREEEERTTRFFPNWISSVFPKQKTCRFWCYGLETAGLKTIATFPVRKGETFSIWIVLKIALLCNSCPTLW